MTARYRFIKNASWGFLINQIFSLFPIVKMNANYAEICRVGNMVVIFNKFRLFIFSKIFTILLLNINNLKSAKKSKKYFLRQKFQKVTLL